MHNKELNNNKLSKKHSFDEVKYQFLAACCGNSYYFFLSLLAISVNRVFLQFGSN